jgi:FkbM family methyltransferase
MPTEVALKSAARSPTRCDDLVFDIGMNNGEDTDFYLKKGFRVVAVEANPALCEAMAARRGAEIANGRLTILNRAISKAGGPIRFFICRTKSNWSTASVKFRDRAVRQGARFDETLVDGMTPAELLARYGSPRYAKIDIEGLELTCIAGWEGAGPPPRFLSFETDFKERDEMIGLLGRLGYRRFALVGQRGVAAQRPPRPALEGLDVDHSFGEFSSGLFGAELPAGWMDAAQLRRRCDEVVRQYRALAIARRLGRALPWLAPALERRMERLLPLAFDWYDVHASV